VRTLLLILAVLLCGCKSPRQALQTDLTSPGWRVRQGQAIWQPGKNRPELAGEVILAVRSPEEFMVQFIKTPFPIVLAQGAERTWQVDFGPNGRRFAGRGTPPGRLIWLHVPRWIEFGAGPPRNWTFEQPEPRVWLAFNRRTGERLEVHLDP
jgi:hypothetical protein